MTNHFVFVIDTARYFLSLEDPEDIRYAHDFGIRMCSFCTGYVGGLDMSTSEWSNIGAQEAEDFKRYFEPEGINFKEILLPDCNKDDILIPFETWFEATGSRDLIESDGALFHLQIKPGSIKIGGGNMFCAGIRFSRKPTSGEIDILRQRAREYGKRNKIEILGFRLFEYQRKELKLEEER